MGRPSKYDPSYCEQVIELGKQGMSVVEIACELGVSRNTLETNWPEQHSDFLQAFARAREESQAWWERAGRTGMTADKFNAQVWSRSMAARFPNDWRENRGVELTGKDGKDLFDKLKEDDDVVTGAIAGLAARSGTPGVAEQP